MKMKKNFLFLSILTLTILLSNLVSAQWYRYSYLSPSNLLENEWVVFGLIFVIFFAIIFFALSKTFKENLAVPAIITAALSLFISMVLVRKVSFYGYVGEEIGGYATFLAILIAIAFFLKAMFDLLGPIGLAFSVIAAWLAIRFVDWEAFLPYAITESDIFLLVKEWPGLVIAIVIAIFIIAARKKLRKKTSWERMWGSRD